MIANSQKRKWVDDDTNSSGDSPPTCMGLNYNLHDVIDVLPMTLEKFPEEILQNIFENLNPSDLLTLCEVSRNLYVTAAICLYRRIIITSRAHKEIRTDVETWTSRKCTVTHKPRKLVQSVSANAMLASCIETIIIDVEENEDDEDDILWLPLFSLCNNLKIFQHREDADYDDAIYARVFGATCHVKKMPVFGPNLTELRLVYVCDYHSRKSFEQVAISMMYTNAYVNLKTLHMEHKVPYHYGDHYEIPRETPEDPYWLSFFEIFGVNKIKLNLETLGLDGHFEMRADKAAKVVRSAVDFTKLKTLELIYTENAHPDFMHEDDLDVNPGILELLTKDAKSLVNLYLNYKYYCHFCQDSSLLIALTTILTNPLKQLYLETVPPEHFSYMLDQIVKAQYELEKFEIELDYPEFNVDKLIIPNLEDVLYLSRERADIYYRRRFYTPCYNFTHECQPYASATAKRNVRRYFQSLYAFLCYSDVFEREFFMWDKLVDFCYCGFHWDQENNTLLLNGKSIQLDPYLPNPPITWICDLENSIVIPHYPQEYTFPE